VRPCTHIRHVFYKASCKTWWNFSGLNKGQPDPHEQFIQHAVVWHPGLFITLATRIVQQLSAETTTRRRNNRRPLFGAGELLIFVGMSLGRLLRPFELFMREVLNYADLRQHVDLEGVTESLVSCRQPNDTTGPTFKYAYVVRHPRYRRSSSTTFTVEESQATGVQVNTCSLYTQLTRATHETVVFLHDFPCGTPTSPMELPNPRHQLAKRIQDLAYHRDVAGKFQWVAVNCDSDVAQPVFQEDGWTASGLIGDHVARVAKTMLNTKKRQILQASGLSAAPSVKDVLRQLPQHTLLNQDFNTAKRKFRAFRGEPPPCRTLETGPGRPRPNRQWPVPRRSSWMS
jgi:hypothetical protein